jgi:hypothetical protein
MKEKGILRRVPVSTFKIKVEKVGDVETVVAPVVYITCVGWRRLGMWGTVVAWSFISPV